jgi:hypothetical protein
MSEVCAARPCPARVVDPLLQRGVGAPHLVEPRPGVDGLRGPAGGQIRAPGLQQALVPGHFALHLCQDLVHPVLELHADQDLRDLVLDALAVVQQPARGRRQAPGGVVQSLEHLADGLLACRHHRRVTRGVLGGRLHRGRHGAGDHLHLGADPLAGLAGQAGELAHLVAHHAEAATGIAGPRRLDGGVQRQQIGLGGDLAHVLGHALEVLGEAGQAADLLQQPVPALQGRFQRVHHAAQAPVGPGDQRGDAAAHAVGGGGGISIGRRQLAADAAEARGQCGAGRLGLYPRGLHVPGPQGGEPRPEIRLGLQLCHQLGARLPHRRSRRLPGRMGGLALHPARAPQAKAQGAQRQPQGR